MKETLEKVDGLLANSVPFTPTWTAYNDAGNELVDLVLSTLDGIPSGTVTRQKYRIVIASFLTLSREVMWKDDGVLAIPKRRAYWGHYDVGADTILNATKQLEAVGFLTFVPESGKRHFFDDEEGNIQWKGVLSQYSIDESLMHLEGYDDAAWIETERPRVTVGKYETYAKRKSREAQQIKKPKMPVTAMREQFGRTYGKARVGVREMNSYWKEHPLALPPKGNGFIPLVACATRVYHNGRMDAGGRYYGAWTSMDKSQRLKATIDGENLVEIDLNASQPTLFSSLMGFKMEVGDSWSDLYSVIVDGLDGDDVDLKRRKIKQVTVEVIGSGQVGKQHPSPDSKYTFDGDEYDAYRNALVSTVPALKLLQSVYDDGYYNGAGYISYHEAEIMTEALVRLMKEDVPSYPIHDCLLVKQSDQEVALETYRSVVRDYILKQSKNKVNLCIPVSIEIDGKEKTRLEGYYY